ncbi:MAG: tetratricopeptide repeat protein [Magnetococcales bacterium]|nr:tetratricopeptide repeat protein [Magnetococcales bacterium]
MHTIHSLVVGRGAGGLLRLALAVGTLLLSLPVAAAAPENLQAGAEALAARKPLQAVAAFSRALQASGLTPEQRVAALAGRCAARYQQHLIDNNLERVRQSITNCERAIAIQADHPLSYRLRGISLLRLGRLEQALADLNVAVALDPNDPLAILHRGVAKIQLELLTAAVEDLDKAVLLNPAYPSGYYYRGRARALQGRHEESVADFSQFLQIIQQDSSAHQQAEQDRLLTTVDPASAVNFQKALAAQPADGVLHALQERPAPPPEPQPTLPAVAPDKEPANSPVVEVESPVVEMESRVVEMESRVVEMESPVVEMESPVVEMESPVVEMESPDVMPESEIDAAIEREVEKNRARVGMPHTRGKFSFKIESFRESSNADRALGQATRLNLRVYVKKIEVDQKSHIQVWVGPFDTSAEAEAARQRIKAAGYNPEPPRKF